MKIINCGGIIWHLEKSLVMSLNRLLKDDSEENRKKHKMVIGHTINRLLYLQE